MQLNEFFVSLFNVLPTLLVLLGGAFCAAYGRQRELFLLLVVYLLYYQLDTQIDYFVLHQQAREDAGLVFHLGSLLLPLLYGLYALWQERTHLFQDLLARAAVLLLVIGVAVALANRFPQGVQAWLTEIRWPALHASWMRLIQLAYPLFLAVLLLLAIQYVHRPRPLHAALLLGLAGLFWMLPEVFIRAHALHVMSSLAMLMLVAAVAHEAYQMAFRDELTGLPGRRALNERLLRLGRQYVIAMTDVDHFKRFNDTYGHDVGDQVLRVVAAQLRKVGGGGRAYRYGGEEFVVVFPGKTLDECLPHLELLRKSIEMYVLQLRDQSKRPRDDAVGRQTRRQQGGGSVSVTISIGAAERHLPLRTAEDVIKAADKALYSAKNSGRNCVRVDGQRRSGAVRLAEFAG
ncbi:GGDEF domain-containing protein [Pseudomonas sp. N040]|nr:GGDEF domain-containing protein [Pseudomonas sp. N040]MBW7012149.1 GGDEF domain-containing protein [Pseudomonas sp. N040]